MQNQSDIRFNNTKKVFRIADFLSALISEFRTEIMGLCIVWIMFFHSGIDAPENTFLRALWYVLVSFGGGFGVNIFLILSGFGLMYSALKRQASGKSESVLSFYKRRLIRILPTYFVVAITYYLIKFNGVGNFFYNLFFINFIVDGVRDYWYIFAILICYLLFPLYKFLIGKFNSRAVFVVALLLNFSINFLLYFVLHDFYSKWEILLWRIPCFWIGCHLGFAVYKKQLIDYIVLLFTSTIFGVVLIILFGYVHAPAVVDRVEIVLLSLFVLTVFTLLFSLLSKIAKWINVVFAFLGKRSLEIYVVHVSIGAYLARMIAVVIGGEPVRLICYFVISIALSVVIKIVLDYVIKRIEKGTKNV